MSSGNVRSGESPDHQSHNFEDFSEFLMFDEWENPSLVFDSFPNPALYQANNDQLDGGNSSSSHPTGRRRDESEGGRERSEVKERVAFKTQSEVEILDDGFKWRKYGKKMVKNSPNPRNYYRCSVEGCPVKKRVERDGEDARFVITTYEGIHNHRSSAS
ncbi:hypothetical protein UlMin_035701 [Ulmus minor]